MTPDLDAALALLGDEAARGEIEAAIAAFTRADNVTATGPARLVRLKAIKAASRLLADAAGELPTLATIEISDLAAIASEAAQEQRRIESELTAASPRWRLLRRLAAIWVARGHRLGNGSGGRFHTFAVAVGDQAGVEITHYSVRQVCAKWRENECRSHTARQAVAA